MAKQIKSGEGGYPVEFYQGGSFHVAYFTWSHFDAACAYLAAGGIELTDTDIGEVLVNFTEAELRDMAKAEGR